jgi:hypothetical protein
VIDSDLVAPEAELGTAPWIVGFFNGVSSLIRFGLTSCHSGFGSTISWQRAVVGGGFPPQSIDKGCNRVMNDLFEPPYLGALDASSSDGELTFRPADPANASSVVDELSLLLTAGRLSSKSRGVIEAEYERMRLGPTDEFVIATHGNCSMWGGVPIESLEECTRAANLTVGQSSPPIEAIPAVDDGHNAAHDKPPGCTWSWWRQLKFNVAGTNFGDCSMTFHCICKVVGERVALQRAQELIMLSPDFHTANEPTPANVPRPPSPPPASAGRPYKAIVVLFLAGGFDSWNLLGAAADRTTAPPLPRPLPLVRPL